MADDWAVGDLALCVAVTHPAFSAPASTLRVGAIYHVERIGRLDKTLGERALGLIEAKPRREGYGWPETLFRKIKPLSDDERDSFLADLDAPISPAAPSRSHAGDRPNDDASTPSPLANPASSLPESVSAPNCEALSGFLFNPVHDREVSHP